MITVHQLSHHGPVIIVQAVNFIFFALLFAKRHNIIMMSSHDTRSILDGINKKRYTAMESVYFTVTRMPYMVVSRT